MRPLSWMLVIAWLLPGCTANRPDLVETGYVSLHPEIASTLAHAPKVYELDGGLAVEGLHDPSEITKGGHVDVRVIGPDGTVIEHASDNDLKPRARVSSGPRGGLRGRRAATGGHSRYSVHFPGLPPPGSVISVKYDPGPHEAAGSE